MLLLSWPCLFLFLSCLWRVSAFSDYNERLLLRPLPQSSLLASFTFRSNTSSSSFEEQNYRYFPRSLAQILQHSHTKELHLRFSSGRWDEERWGARPRGGSREGGTGVEVWAWVEAQTDEEADLRWLTLTNALSGLFCASLNFIDSPRTIRPLMAFRPEGHHVNTSAFSLHLLHGTLPREIVCTENLTPFLKLLPCKGKAGISSLLDGHKLFDSVWQSMSVDVRPVCSANSSECLVEMEQTIDMLLDIERAKRPRDDPIPRPAKIEDIACDTSKPYHQYGDSCYPLQGPAFPQFSLEAVFGRPVRGNCPLVDSDGHAVETLCIDVPSNREIKVISRGEFAVSHVDDRLRCYKMPVGMDFDLNFTELGSAVGTPLETSLIRVDRTLTGRGQEHGGLNRFFVNPTSTSSIDFVYLESLPWFMKPFLHTLHTEVRLLPHAGSQPQNLSSPIKEMHYRPAVDRSRATHLELLISLPPSSTLTLTYDFEKAFLRYAEYPPDANRGFDIAPAVVRVLSATSPTYIRTTSLLLYLPTPDFSMPYNVIILTSTVIALGFGSIFNIVVRRFVSAEEAKAMQSGGLISRMRARLMRRFARKTKAE